MIDFTLAELLTGLDLSDDGSAFEQGTVDPSLTDKVRDGGVTIRIYNALIGAGLERWSDVGKLSFRELAKIPNIATVSLNEIIENISIRNPGRDYQVDRYLTAGELRQALSVIPDEILLRVHSRDLPLVARPRLKLQPEQHDGLKCAEKIPAVTFEFGKENPVSPPDESSVAKDEAEEKPERKSSTRYSPQRWDL